VPRMSEGSLNIELNSLVVMMAIAVAAPIAIRYLRLRVAEVVLLIIAGVIVGPEVLNLITVDPAINLVGQLGLGFLFFLAGFELEPVALRGRTGRLAAIAWGVSITTALVLSYALLMFGLIDAAVGFAIVLTSTALGTLLPVVRDNGELNTPFGRMFMGAGAWGEFGPIIAISIFLGTQSALAALLSLALFSVVALLIAFVPRQIRSQGFNRYLIESHHTSSQTAVRITMLLLIGLLAVAGGFGLDIVMGAFVAGVILRQFLSSAEETSLQEKIEAIGFGFFIPAFFILSGANLDIASILSNPWPMLIVFALLIVVRGLPTFLLYRGVLPDLRDRTRLSLYTATGLPIIVAVTAVQVQAGLMSTNDAAELVAAGALSVMVFPLIAQLLRRRETPQPERSDATA
jgi:Kef-type K+ transport system membrane component KefB